MCLGRALLLSGASQLLQNPLVCQVTVPGCPWHPSAWAALSHQLSLEPACSAPPARPACPSPHATAACLPGGSNPPRACPGFACDTPGLRQKGQSTSSCLRSLAIDSRWMRNQASDRPCCSPCRPQAEGPKLSCPSSRPRAKSLVNTRAARLGTTL